MSSNSKSRYELPSTQRKASGSSTTVIVAIVLASLLACFLVCSGLIAVFLMPTTVASAHRMQCINNLKQIGLALHNYHSEFGVLPPAYTVDANGNRLHSWRTLILPYMEQRALYQRIDLTKPWDDPANTFLLELNILTYQCPSSKLGNGWTTYQVIDDPSSAFPGSATVKFSDIVDGTSDSVCIVETDKQDAVHWAEPSDQSLLSYLSAVKAPHIFGRNALMVDGSVHFLKKEIDSNVSQGIVTINGGEVVKY